MKIEKEHYQYIKEQIAHTVATHDMETDIYVSNAEVKRTKKPDILLYKHLISMSGVSEYIRNHVRYAKEQHINVAIQKIVEELATV
jgi:D-arabinose 5-phosphate isomerase GutQ